jgi:hypothetical protein
MPSLISNKLTDKVVIWIGAGPLCQLVIYSNDSQPLKDLINVPKLNLRELNPADTLTK